MVSRLLTVTAAAAVLSGALVAVPAWAAPGDGLTTSSYLTVAALDTLGITVEDQGLLEELSATESEAVDAGLVDQDLIDAVPSTFDPNNPLPPIEEAEPEPSSEAAPPAEGEMPPAEEKPKKLDELIVEHLSSEASLWAAAVQEWLIAFDAIKDEFHACMDAPDADRRACVSGQKTQMQLAYADALSAAYDKRIADITALPEDQQADALTKLEEQHQKALDILERAGRDAAADGQRSALDGALEDLRKTVPSEDPALEGIRGRIGWVGIEPPEILHGSQPPVDEGQGKKPEVGIEPPEILHGSQPPVNPGEGSNGQGSGKPGQVGIQDEAVTNPGKGHGSDGSAGNNGKDH